MLAAPAALAARAVGVLAVLPLRSCRVSFTSEAGYYRLQFNIIPPLVAGGRRGAAGGVPAQGTPQLARTTGRPGIEAFMASRYYLMSSYLCPKYPPLSPPRPPPILPSPQTTWSFPGRQPESAGEGGEGLGHGEALARLGVTEEEVPASVSQLCSQCAGAGLLSAGQCSLLSAQ